MSDKGPMKLLGRVQYEFNRPLAEAGRLYDLVVYSSHGTYIMHGQDVLMGATAVYKCDDRVKLPDGRYKFGLKFTGHLEGESYSLWMKATTAELRRQYLPLGCKGKPW